MGTVGARQNGELEVAVVGVGEFLDVETSLHDAAHRLSRDGQFSNRDTFAIAVRRSHIARPEYNHLRRDGRPGAGLGAKCDRRGWLTGHTFNQSDQRTIRCGLEACLLSENIQ